MTPEEKAAGKALSRLQRHGAQTLWLAMAAPLLGGALLVWQAWELASLLGRAIEGGEAPQALLPGIGLVLALLLTRAGLSALGEWFGSIGAEAIKLKLRELLFTGLLARSPRRGDAASSGAATAAIVDQVEAIDAYYARYLPAAAQAALLPLAFGAVILPLDWVAGILFIVTAPLIPVFMALVGWGAQRASDSQAQALTRLSGRFGDRLRGLLTLKLFGRADAETDAIVAASDALRQRTLRVLRIAFLSSAVLEFFAALGVAGVALYLGLTFIEFLNLRGSPLTLHVAVFLLLMAPEVYNPLRLLASHYHDRAAAKAALVEIERQLGALPDATELLEDLAPRSGPAIAVAFENLTLRTPDRQKIVLHDVSLDIPAGRHVALLGPSGEGKTTLLETIAALRPHEGRIRLDTEPLADWSPAALRARTFLLTQKPRLIHASIADNIALARPDASRSEIEQAAELAFVTPFADALADGLDTMISEDGIGLSGGQAQRVALARVFLRDAGLILLDEPTAHLDSALEGQIIDNIIEYARGRTLIVSTHSAAVAAKLDKAWRIAGETLLPVAIPAKKKGAA